MNQFSKHIKNNKLTTVFIMVVFMFLSSVSGYSQEIASANTNEVANETKQTNVSTSSSSNMNFVLWFMGSNQSPNTTISNEGNITKKNVITSGIAPNRLLIKAFLKKAANFESALS